jgi:hypothetical protein
MKSLRKWLDNKIAKLNCFANGHGPWFVLHVYDTKKIARYFTNDSGKILRVKESVEITYELQKRKCLKCGRVSVDHVAIGGEWQ